VKITDIRGTLPLSNGIRMPYFGLGVFDADIFDFELTDEELKTIDALDHYSRYGADPENFNF